jgi:hypothetical protein
MKKIITIASVLAMVSLCSCKKTSVSAPEAPQQSISYVDANIYIAQSLITYQNEGKLNMGRYKTTSALLQSLSNQPSEGVVNNMNYVFLHAGHVDINSLPVNNLSSAVSSIISKFLTDLNSSNSSQELNDLFQSNLSKISTNTLLSLSDKSVLNVYFAAVKTSTDFIATRLAQQNLGARTEWSLWGAVKCAAGTVGGAVLGGLAGAAVGTVTLPLIGTVSGASVGFWGGALSGMALAC